MRIALFGGSFDPPHLGHAHIAREAADRLRLDRVLFAPVASQPLKRHMAQPAPFADRVAMLDAMLEDPRFVSSTLDAPRPDGTANYTFDTLQTLRRTLAPSDELFFLVGADSLHTLPHWHRASELLSLASWIVAARPGSPTRQLLQTLQAVGPGSLEELPFSNPGVESFVLQRPSAPPVALYVLPDLSELVSATSLRAALAQGGAPADGTLAPAVRDYIQEHHLYGAAGTRATMGSDHDL